MGREEFENSATFYRGEMQAVKGTPFGEGRPDVYTFTRYKFLVHSKSSGVLGKERGHVCDQGMMGLEQTTLNQCPFICPVNLVWNFHYGIMSIFISYLKGYALLLFSNSALMLISALDLRMVICPSAFLDKLQI